MYFGQLVKLAGPKRRRINYYMLHIAIIFIDENGQPAGIAVDLWKLWSTNTGIDVEFKGAGRHDTIAMVRDGRADIHAGFGFSQASTGRCRTKRNSHRGLRSKLPAFHPVGCGRKSFRDAHRLMAFVG
ncbi:MAG: transporter substrate-binding domain-containing protein [bacterium]|nr:transporter substrate-binding domain-containing protein [bacterium]